MKQYCRYCTYLVVGDANYCTVKNKCMSESSAKSVNRCREFELNVIDAFGENQKEYTPREPKEEQIEGQLNILDYCQE